MRVKKLIVWYVLFLNLYVLFIVNSVYFACDEEGMKFHCVPKPLTRSCDTLQRKSYTPSPPLPSKIQDSKGYQSTGNLNPEQTTAPSSTSSSREPESECDSECGGYKVVKMRPERWYKIDYPSRDGPLAYYSVSICNICNRHNTKGKVSRFMKIFKRNKETDEYVDPKAYSLKFLDAMKKKFVLPPDESQVSDTWSNEQSESSDI